MIDFRRESAVTHPTEGRPLPVLFSSQQDHDTQRLYRLYDFSKSQIIHPALRNRLHQRRITDEA